MNNHPNVLLSGDTLGDIGMIGTMKNYKRTYDIVICDDQTFHVSNVILNSI
jgi:hypothetical protein